SLFFVLLFYFFVFFFNASATTEIYTLSLHDALPILALNKVEMIWQDGEIYQAPAQDLLPEPVQLDILNLQGEMQIYLALPMVQPNKQNVSYSDQAQSSRYHSHLSATHDLFTEIGRAHVTLLRRRAE